MAIQELTIPRMTPTATIIDQTCLLDNLLPLFLIISNYLLVTIKFLIQSSKSNRIRSKKMPFLALSIPQ